MFGPKYSVKEVVERRPPLLRLGIVVVGALVLSAVSAVALVGAGDGDDDEVNAGVPPGTELTASSSLRVTEDGAVVDALDVKGNIVVLADGVTIKRTKVTTSGAHAIRVGSGSTGLTVEDSTLECTSEKGRSGVAWNNYTATRVAVDEDCRRGFVYGPNTTITDSYWGDEPFEDQEGRPSPTTTVERKTSSWTTPTTAAPVTTAPPAPTTTTPDLSVAPTRPRPGNGVGVKETCRNADNLANGTQPRPGFPTDATTGPQVDGYDETFMSPSGHSGTWVISRDGATVDGVFHNGAVEVTGDNVTIRNSIICGHSNMIVSVEGQNLTIENSIIRGERGKVFDGETGAPCQATVGYGKFTIRRSELTYCIDGLKASGSTKVYDSYLHDSYTNRYGGGAGTHNDTVQSVESPMPELIFEGNAVYQDPCTSNRHFQLAPLESQPATNTLRVDSNFFYGMKGFNLDRGFKVVNGSIASNTFAGSATSGPFSSPMYSGDGMGSVARRGNVFEQSGAADGDMTNSYRCVP
jgi:hypothetical protein